ncbi:MAG TPA: ROK family protein [Anaerolineae bacterium]|nr:ROK family protein [Anaerolineae bacterium]
MGSLQFIAVDLGGTQIRAARYTADDVLEARVAMPTEADEGQSAVLRRVQLAIHQVWPMDNPVSGIAIGVPGPIDFKRGVVRFAPNLPGWQNVPLRDILLEKFHAPVFVGNDADVAALAEHRFGAGRGVADMIYMTISTGIGGGMIFNNRLFTGGNGLGGEIGHLVVDMQGPLCGCGNSGCLEVMASGTAIARQARERIIAGEPSVLLEMVRGDLAKITAKEVNEAGQQGDPLSISVFEQAGAYLGATIVGMMYLLNPSLFVLGGSVTLAGDLLFGPLRQTIAARAPQAYQEQTRVVPAMLGGDVGLWGALALSLMELGL